MTNDILSTTLTTLGFVEGDRDPKNVTHYADLGAIVPGLWYGHREYKGQWQYVSLCTYLGEFVEAVVIVYEKKFNSRQKLQQSPLFSTLARSLVELTPHLEKVYDLPKKA